MASKTSSEPAPKALRTAGTLSIEVLGARNLQPAVLGSLLKWTPSYSNPYVAVALGKEEFVTRPQSQTLNPTWKESGVVSVPLPTEQELLQTLSSFGDEQSTINSLGVLTKASKNGKTVGKLAAGDQANASMQHYKPCTPELVIRVFHRAENTSPSAASAGSDGSVELHGQGREGDSAHTNDKLIGSVLVPLLPCLLSQSSSHRGWHTLVDDEFQTAGQIQLSLNYDCADVMLEKGDIVRITGFGGMEYYGKLLPPGARLEVVDTFQDEAVVETQSVEGWPIVLECHRNLLHLERRPSMLQDAQTQIQGQMTRVRDSPLVSEANKMYMKLPSWSRRQIGIVYHFSKVSGSSVVGAAYETARSTVSEGPVSGFRTSRAKSEEAYHTIRQELVNSYHAIWSRDTSAEDGDPQITGGSRGRGRIVAGFVTTQEINDAVADSTGINDETEEKPAARLSSLSLEEEEVKEADMDDWTDDEDCPEQLICPITGCPMLDPVVAADGHTYDRKAILHWFSTSDKSPMTGAKMPTKQVFPNFALRSMSEEFQRAKKEKTKEQ